MGNCRSAYLNGFKNKKKTTRIVITSERITQIWSMKCADTSESRNKIAEIVEDCEENLSLTETDYQLG